MNHNPADKRRISKGPRPCRFHCNNTENKNALIREYSNQSISWKWIALDHQPITDPCKCSYTIKIKITFITQILKNICKDKCNQWNRTIPRPCIHGNNHSQQFLYWRAPNLYLSKSIYIHFSGLPLQIIFYNHKKQQVNVAIWTENFKTSLPVDIMVEGISIWCKWILLCSLRCVSKPWSKLRNNTPCWVRWQYTGLHPHIITEEHKHDEVCNSLLDEQNQTSLHSTAHSDWSHHSISRPVEFSRSDQALYIWKWHVPENIH